MPDEIVVAVEEFKREVPTLAQQAKAFAIVTQEDVTAVAARVSVIDALLGRIGDTYDKRISQAHEIHKGLLADKRGFTEPLDAARKVYTEGVKGWLREQQRIQQEAAARIEREKREREEAARLAEAAALEEAGEVELANEIMDAPVVIAPEPAFKPKDVLTSASGFVGTKTWKAVVVDEGRIFMYAAAHPEWRGLFKLDQGALDRAAKSMKGNFCIDGATAYEDTGIRKGKT